MILDYLQDTIKSLEDEGIAGETQQPAYLQTNDRDCGFGESESYSDVIDRVKPEMSVVGVFQWLTGQCHKPVNGEKITVTVEFEHDYLFPKCKCMWKSNSNPCCSHEFNQKLQKSVFHRILQRTSLFETISKHTAKFFNVVTLKRKFCFPK